MVRPTLCLSLCLFAVLYSGVCMGGGKQADIDACAADDATCEAEAFVLLQHTKTLQGDSEKLAMNKTLQGDSEKLAMNKEALEHAGEEAAAVSAEEDTEATGQGDTSDSVNLAVNKNALEDAGDSSGNRRRAPVENEYDEGDDFNPECFACTEYWGDINIEYCDESCG